MNTNMTIDEMITYLQVQVFRRKYGPGQHSELVAALERECAPYDVYAVVKDYEWFHVPGRTLPSPHEIRRRCLEEKHSRLRRAESPVRGKGDGSDLLSELTPRSYPHRVYMRAFMLLYRSRKLDDLGAHEAAVQQAIAELGEPTADDTFCEVGGSGAVSDRLKHLQETVNRKVADFDPFAS